MAVITEKIVKKTCSKKADLHDRLNPDWAPSIGLRGAQILAVPEETPSVSRYNRIKNRTQRRLYSEEIRGDEIDSVIEDFDDVNVNSKFVSTGVQTGITFSFINGMECEINSLRSELESIKKQQTVLFNEEFFVEDDDKVKQLTGINTYAVLMVVFEYLANFLPCSESLSKFEIFIMTLMRLRLNLSSMFIAYLFQVSPSTVSRLFSSTIDAMYERLHPSIYWPARETLEKTMPMQFRKHFGRKCAVIIDCFEVFIERPSRLEARAETWSSYKHHHTVKFLIGITPQGTVCFVSKAWGGRTSDKHLTENCGFLFKIMPGDLVLADRGFDIGASVGSHAGHVHIPAFTRGQNQLSAADIETTRKLANVRIHVERVIGLVRQKYTFLIGVIPIRFLMQKDENDVSTIDKIALICCALINFNDSIVAVD
ncbi:uncharacterized protein LOC128233081 [Mya arenaria]|uniref:uncharacterized protein LOC128233081 n=1 Tax=Mya arenaria TaxID=6604 RepID=UPI0022E96E2A|nr:uncharacterized protein LOC128233081 [Mya arenaria]